MATPKVAPPTGVDDDVEVLVQPLDNFGSAQAAQRFSGHACVAYQRSHLRPAGMGKLNREPANSTCRTGD
jgi:hypothetical protein